MGEPNISFTDDLKRIQPKPGEVFFLSVPGSINSETADHLQKMWKLATGDLPVIVLSDGIQVGCFAPPEKVY